MPETKPYSCRFYAAFNQRVKFLISRVKYLRKKRDDYQSHKDYKLFLCLCRVIEQSLLNPNAPCFNLGDTLGPDYKHWKRCKEGLPKRYRLFFQFRSADLQCVYAWLNDEKTLRKEDGKTDVYAVFRKLLARGIIPNDFFELLQQSVPGDINYPDIL